MRALFVVAAMSAGLACLPMARAMGAGDPPQVWQCASLARWELVDLRMEGAFGALLEANGGRPADFASAEEIERRIAAAEARAARWGGELELTESQGAYPGQLSEDERKALRDRCAALFDAEGQRAPASPPASPIPGAAGAARVSFAPEPATDRYGNDLGMAEVAPRDFDTGRAMCAANDRCQAFTLYTPPPFDKGYCWMKHAPGTPSPSDHSISAVR